MTVADSIAEFLADKGITHAFGIIGAGNVALFEAITRLAKTEIVCCHHEQAAVMAATFWGRVNGKCGVAIVTTGAGSANAITGALSAQMDSVPALVISGNEPSRYLMAKTRVIGVQGFHTAWDVEGFVKRSIQWHGDRTLEQAYDVAISGRPGPVWIDVPRDYFNEVVN